MILEELRKGHKTHWQWYRDFFNITVLRYLVTWFAIVPIVAKVLLQIPLVINFHEVNISLNLSLPFSWRLLWLSSFFFVLALGLYNLFCPGFIKTYSTYRDYQLYGHSPRWIIWESLKIMNNKNELPKFFSRLSEKGYLSSTQKEIEKNVVLVEKEQTRAFFKYNELSYYLGLPIVEDGHINKGKTEIAEREIFWEVFGRFSSSRRFVRFLILLCLIISLICFLIVLIQNVIAGFKYVLGSWVS